jgi:hypothetical protein
MDKYIKGYEGLYKITTNGVVYLDERVGYRGKIIPRKIKSQRLVRNYYAVTLIKNNKPLTKKIHRLVAETYIPNPDNKPFVNHKDGNKLNNNVHNLEWVTPLENVKHAWENGLVDYKGEKVYTAKLTSKDVILIRTNCKSYEDKIAFSKIYNINLSTINRLLRNETWKHIK